MVGLRTKLELSCVSMRDAQCQIAGIVNVETASITLDEITC